MLLLLISIIYNLVIFISEVWVYTVVSLSLFLLEHVLLELVLESYNVHLWRIELLLLSEIRNLLTVVDKSPFVWISLNCIGCRSISCIWKQLKWRYLGLPLLRVDLILRLGLELLLLVLIVLSLIHSRFSIWVWHHWWVKVAWRLLLMLVLVVNCHVAVWSLTYVQSLFESIIFFFLYFVVISQFFQCNSQVTIFIY